jgi:uncharacterized protein (TIGR02147 family)
VSKKGDKARSATRPNIYAFHGYREFLKHWLSYLRETTSGFTLRGLSRSAGLAQSYLPMLTSGKRRLSPNAAEKLLPHLKLSTTEGEFFRLLITLENARSQSVRIGTLTRMRKFRGYRLANPKEAEVHEYLTHWYYVAIREMTALEDFRADPAWIRSRLRYPVEERAIRRALTFLVDNGYIVVDEAGHAAPPDKDLICVDDVYRAALRHYHKEALTLGAEALDAVPIEERFVMGYTLPIHERKLPEARQVIEKAILELQKLAARRQDAESVHQVEMVLFPLTTRSDSSEVRDDD